MKAYQTLKHCILLLTRLASQRNVQLLQKIIFKGNIVSHFSSLQFSSFNLFELKLNYCAKSTAFDTSIATE